jgi:hypothetical protein
MAANTNPVFIDSPLTTTANTQIANTIVNADGTDTKDVVNGATDGTVIQDLVATSTDSSDRVLLIYLYDGDTWQADVPGGFDPAAAPVTSSNATNDRREILIKAISTALNLAPEGMGTKERKIIDEEMARGLIEAGMVAAEQAAQAEADEAAEAAQAEADKAAKTAEAEADEAAKTAEAETGEAVEAAQAETDGAVETGEAAAVEEASEPGTEETGQPPNEA